MEVIVKCPSCNAALPVKASEKLNEIACGSCQKVIALTITPAVATDTSVDTCPMCTGKDFYIRKDFDPKVGLAFVILGATVSAVFYYFGMDLTAYGVLAVAVFVDLAVYRRLGDVTICYRCQAEFRGHFEHMAESFDLHTADVLEAEYAKQAGR